MITTLVFWVRFLNSTSNFKDLQANGKLENLSNEINDIEDLVAYGKDNLRCPFYISRELQKTADIIFMPYNYLLDQNTRRSLSLDLDGAVIILDEAHNLVRSNHGRY